MAAFGEKIEFFPPIAYRLSDQLFAVIITFGGVDHVEAGVERAIEKLCDRFRRSLLVTDLGSSKSKSRNVHVGLSKATFFHQFMLCCRGVCVKRPTNKQALGTSASTTSNAFFLFRARSGRFFSPARSTSRVWHRARIRSRPFQFPY